MDSFARSLGTLKKLNQLQMLSLVLLSIILSFNFPAAFIILPLLTLFFRVIENKFRISLKIFEISRSGYLLTILFGIHFLWFIGPIVETGSTSLLETSLPLLLFPLMISSTRVDEEGVKKVFIVFTYAVVVSYCLSLLAAVYHYFYSNPRWGRASDFFFHEQFTSGLFDIHPTYYSLLGCLATLVSFKFTTKSTRLILVFVLTIFIILINARITILIQSLLIVFFMVREFRRGFTLKRLAIAATVLVLTFGFLKFSGSVYDYPHRKMLLNLEASWDRSYGSDISDADGGLVIRLAVWRNAVEAIKQNVLFGNGIGNEKEQLLEEFKKNDVPFLISNSFDSHNQILTYMISMGLIGCVALGLFFLWLMQSAIKSRQWFYLALMAIFFIVGMTESVFNRGLGVATFSFFNSFVFLKIVKSDA